MIKCNRYRVFAGIWVACIYSTLSVVRPVCEILKKNAWFAPGINFILGGLLIVLLLRLIMTMRKRRLLSYFLLLGVLLCYLYGLVKIEYPEEKIHFLEYGFLAYLIYRALRLDYSKILSYTGAFILTTVLGWIDEGIQHILPNRYYQNEDVFLNSVSGVLALLLIFIFEREQLILEKK